MAPAAASGAGPSGATVSLLERHIVTWAAGIVAAAAIGYVVLGNYLPSFGWTRKTDKDVVPGLYNRSNPAPIPLLICKGLAGVPSFREYLKERVDKYAKSNIHLSRALLDLLTGTQVIMTVPLMRVLNLPAGKVKTRSVEGVILALESLYNSRISRNQQDSQEFLHLIHEALDREDTMLKKEDGSQDLRISPNPFQGALSTQITCQRCGFTTPWKKESFTELSLAVPSKWTCNLLECLNSVLTTDPIPDYACPSCTLENTLHSLELIPTKPAPLLRATSRLRTLQNQFKSPPEPRDINLDTIKLPSGVTWKTVKVPAVKRTVLSSPPNVLVLHLVRSMYERGYGAGRNSCEVSFEEEVNVPVGGEDVEAKREGHAATEDEDEEHYMLEHNEKYKLMSVVTHRGVHDYGHYICHRRRRRERKSPRTERLSVNSKGSAISGSMEGIPDERGEGKGGESEESVVGLVLDDGLVNWENQSFSRSKWWETSDEIVIGVQRDDVLSKRKGVYLLFYERTS